MAFKIAALVLIFLETLYSLVCTGLHVKSAKARVPECVRDIYDGETYEKWRKYHAEKTALSVWSTCVSFAVWILLLIFDVYAAFASLFPANAFMQMFSVILLSTLTDILILPFEYIDTMKIEARYGFNKTTVKTFITDGIKNFILSLVLMTLIAWLLKITYEAAGDAVIIVFAAALTAFFLIVAFLSPFFSKIFNKFTPLEEGTLRDRLTDLLEKNGFHVKAIKVMDASRRSTKSNAYFTGLGRTKTIVLFDTLLGSMTEDEICAVFAHEMGHGLHKDILKSQVLSFFRTLLLAVLAWLTLRTPGVFESFGFSGINYGFALLLIFSVEFAVLSPLVSLGMNALLRRMEYRADAEAVRVGYGEALISALKKLSRGNFSLLTPLRALVLLEYSHPALNERLAAIENGMKRGQ